MKVFGIYKGGEGVDAIEARDEKSALRKFARKSGLTEKQIKAYWAEDLYA